MSKRLCAATLGLFAVCLPHTGFAQDLPGQLMEQGATALGQMASHDATAHAIEYQSEADPQANIPMVEEELALGDGEFLSTSDPMGFGLSPTYNCPPAWEYSLNAMYMTAAGNDNRTFSTGFSLDDFDFRPGMKLSLFRHYDCLDGWEITYMGPFEWTDSSFRTGNLQSNLSSTDFNLSAFNNSVSQQQSYQSRFNSLEVNRRWWGWDVITTYAGFRYFRVEEEFLFNSQGAMGDSGQFAVRTDNNALGGQFGFDLKSSLGKWTTTSKIKSGIYGNFAENNVFLSRNGGQNLNNEGDRLVFSFTLDAGYYLSYNILPNVKVHAGYEFWYIYGLAIAPDQNLAPLTTATGLAVERKGDAFYHGGVVGGEIVF